MGRPVDSTPKRDEADPAAPAAQVLALFGICATRLRKWHAAGLLTVQRTKGGHRRYRESDVSALVAELSQVAA